MLHPVRKFVTFQYISQYLTNTVDEYSASSYISIPLSQDTYQMSKVNKNENKNARPSTDVGKQWPAINSIWSADILRHY